MPTLQTIRALVAAGLEFELSLTAVAGVLEAPAGLRPDWQRDGVSLYRRDCLEVVPALAADGVDAVITDPPYFKVKDDKWDRQWNRAGDFLEWLDNCAADWYRVLRSNGSLYCFASSQMGSRVELKLAERFKVLSHIVWAKNHTKAGSIARRQRVVDLRAWFPEQERLLFCENYGADNAAKGEPGYGARCDQLRGFIFEPLRAYLDGEWKRAGLSASDANQATRSFMATHWFTRSQWALPTAKNYALLQERANLAGGAAYLDRGYEFLRRDYQYLKRKYDDLRREYEHLRRPFGVTSDLPFTDVWTFEPVAHYRGKHPCEKPVDMLEHVIGSSTRAGAVVLDPFMGSGSTGVAAVNLGRRFVGVELEPGYFDTAVRRIGAALDAKK